MLPVAYLAEAFAALTGRSGRVTLEGVRMSRKRMYFSSDKAVGELGYRWRPPHEAFEDALSLVSRTWPVGRRSLIYSMIRSAGSRASARRPSTACQITKTGTPTAISRARFSSETASPNSAPTPNNGVRTA